jgi:hypothetical protein
VFKKSNNNLCIIAHTSVLLLVLINSVVFILFIIVTGSTTLRGPWPSSEASASQRIAASDFVTRVFSKLELSAPRSTPGYPGGPFYLYGILYPC